MDNIFYIWDKTANRHWGSRTGAPFLSKRGAKSGIKHMKKCSWTKDRDFEIREYALTLVDTHEESNNDIPT